jgi:hypothetical protein
VSRSRFGKTGLINTGEFKNFGFRICDFGFKTTTK